MRFVISDYSNDVLYVHCACTIISVNSGAGVSRPPRFWDGGSSGTVGGRVISMKYYHIL